MEDFSIAPLRNSSVAYIHQQRPQIEMDPVYQRQGGIWSVEKQQLLIDSLINGFDVPKIYFHEFAARRTVDGKRLRYAIIDGKQRLQAIWEFIDNKFPLADDFKYFEDPDVDVRNLTYSQLAEKNPEIAAYFNATTLDIIAIRTDDLEIIEEMFSRLNEAIPLNAAEKRNALGGPVPPAIRALAEHPFFKERLTFGNTRYRHWDLAVKFLYWSHMGRVVDVKKFHLDSFAKDMKKKDSEGQAAVNDAEMAAMSVLDAMGACFQERDKLLSQVGMVSVYYLVFQEVARTKREANPTREKFAEFEDLRKSNRVVAEADLSEAQFELLEFDRYGQSANDGKALAYRVRVLMNFLEGKLGQDPGLL
ncbi:hypothetical protein BKI49_25150 [Streptomyces sp. Tue6028]|uniref:DUF262 domain-containing protein n=1 Tax=Streptomyces sp. Tue6028 TaxID=2036037 RepID=UPI000BB3607C|nr:DUF262 domain-containing protein [Streptomyces sp. Tue6028]PBC61283.1 hypothetical protein BKI49_25150 [Streptomyces sp. Tue6028]